MDENNTPPSSAAANPALEVDLDKVIRDKSPRLARLLPRFVISWLKRTIHQDQVNHVLRNFGHLEPLEFVRATLDYMDIRYRAVGLENVPPEGRYFFVSNHPFGGLDGLMLVEELNARFGPTKVIVNDLLMHLRPLAPLFIPVNKHGRQKADYARIFREELMSPDHIASFPAGICSRRSGGVVCDKPWHASFVKNAIESRRDVVPVFFEGRLSNFFYNLASLRTRLGIKTNLEMLFLVDEMFSQEGQSFSIVFGKPVPWQEMAAEGTPARWAERIRGMAYALEKNIPQNA